MPGRMRGSREAILKIPFCPFRNERVLDTGKRYSCAVKGVNFCAKRSISNEDTKSNSIINPVLIFLFVRRIRRKIIMVPEAKIIPGSIKFRLEISAFVIVPKKGSGFT